MIPGHQNLIISFTNQQKGRDFFLKEIFVRFNKSEDVRHLCIFIEWSISTRCAHINVCLEKRFILKSEFLSMHCRVHIEKENHIKVENCQF